MRRVLEYVLVDGIFVRRISGGMPYEVLQADLPAVAAAGGTSTFIIGEIPAHETQGTFTIERITVTTPSLVTGVTATAGTFNVRQLRAAAVITAVIGTLALVTGVNL